jgi:uncharacterized membrane protein YhaH (DUF805 family)
MEEGQAANGAGWRFLYRTDEGRIDAATWWRGTLWLAAPFIVLTLALIFVLPYAERDLGKTAFLSVGAFAANLYVVIYTFALILIGICHYNLSAKRLRDTGRPPALAGLLPFLVFLAGASHWLQSRVDSALPPLAPIAVYVLLSVTLLWNIIDLGGLVSRSRARD